MNLSYAILLIFPKIVTKNNKIFIEKNVEIRYTMKRKNDRSDIKNELRTKEYYNKNYNNNCNDFFICIYIKQCSTSS